MAEITMPQDVRTMTFEVSEETRVNFSANYNSVAIRSTGDVGITEYSGKQIGDNGVLKCNAEESILYPNLISKNYVYLVGSGTVEILVGNNLTVNPFKNGAKGGGSGGSDVNVIDSPTAEEIAASVAEIWGE